MWVSIRNSSQLHFDKVVRLRDPESLRGETLPADIYVERPAGLVETFTPRECVVVFGSTKATVKPSDLEECQFNGRSLASDAGFEAVKERCTECLKNSTKRQRVELLLLRCEAQIALGDYDAALIDSISVINEDDKNPLGYAKKVRVLAGGRIFTTAMETLREATNKLKDNEVIRCSVELVIETALDDKEFGHAAAAAELLKRYAATEMDIEQAEGLIKRCRRPSGSNSPAKAKITKSSIPGMEEIFKNPFKVRLAAHSSRSNQEKRSEIDGLFCEREYFREHQMWKEGAAVRKLLQLLGTNIDDTTGNWNTPTGLRGSITESIKRYKSENDCSWFGKSDYTACYENGMILMAAKGSGGKGKGKEAKGKGKGKGGKSSVRDKQAREPPRNETDRDRYLPETAGAPIRLGARATPVKVTTPVATRERDASRNSNPMIKV